MNNTSFLPYSFIRTEADNKYTIFIKIDPMLLEQDLNIELNNERNLSIKTEKGDEFLTDVLPDDLYEHLANRVTLAFFLNESGDIITKQKLHPLKPNSSKRMKP